MSIIYLFLYKMLIYFNVFHFIVLNQVVCYAYCWYIVAVKLLGLVCFTLTPPPIFLTTVAHRCLHHSRRLSCRPWSSNNDLRANVYALINWPSLHSNSPLPLSTLDFIGISLVFILSLLQKLAQNLVEAN